MRRIDGSVNLIALIVLTICSASLPNTIKPTGLVVHHSALTADDLAQFPGPTNASVLDALHERRGFQVYYWGRVYHIGYHYIILPDGTIQRGRPDNCVGAHTQGHNDTLGICLVGNFSTIANPSGSLGDLQPTELQVRSLVELAKGLKVKYGFTCDHIWRHQDRNPKTLCPGDRLHWADIRTRIGCNSSN